MQGTEKILARGAEALGPELTTITGPNRYRPPAGFMNEDSSPENMEVRLHSSACKVTIPTADFMNEDGSS